MKFVTYRVTNKLVHYFIFNETRNFKVTSEMDYFKGGAIYKKVDFNMVMWYNIYKEKERKCSNE